MALVNSQLIDRLLYESEGDALDFKRDQYPFAGATDEQKSELLKDILAFANSWRRTDAFVLIGVEEAPGGERKIVGATVDLDDADLQQFVNSKTQRPIQFSCHSILVGCASIGVIHIPLQNRPVFLKKGFGKLKANVVYLRRGSSTTEALPDEIAQMGAAEHLKDVAAPRLSFHLGDPTTRSIEEAIPILKVANVSAPKITEIPDYTGSGQWELLNHSNRDFHRQLVEYYRIRTSVERVGFALCNFGQILAENASVEMTLPDVEDELLLLKHGELPKKPQSAYGPDHFIGSMAALHRGQEDAITVRRLPNEWQVTVHFGRIRPKEKVWARDSLWIGARSSRVLALPGRIFADNIPDPIPCELHLDLQVMDLTLTLEKAMRALAAETQKKLDDTTE